jgi:hypothetical protein
LDKGGVAFRDPVREKLPARQQTQATEQEPQNISGVFSIKSSQHVNAP